MLEGITYLQEVHNVLVRIIIGQATKLTCPLHHLNYSWFQLKVIGIDGWSLDARTDPIDYGNSKVLNSETGDDLLSQTHMTANGYAITVTLFSLAYTVFEVPSNWIMKHYVRPSLWLALLLGLWGAFTIGFAGVHNYATVVVLRWFIGVFEAGFFPGE